MDIVSTQIGQNFAGDITSKEKLPAVDLEKSQQAQKQTSIESFAIQSEEDIQGNADSADNYSREEQNAELNVAAQEIQSFLQEQNRNLVFSVDEGSNRSVVTVKDSASGDVIRQIPSNEVLRLAERIKELQQDIGSSVGVLLNRQV